MVAYNRLKTPFFNIFIADSNGSNFIKLPESVKKLVTKLEILETFQTETCMHSKISLTFIEGSREPYQRDSDTDTKVLYGSDAVLTNKSGMLADLRFQTNGGILGLTAQSADSIGKALKLDSSLTGTTDNLLTGSEEDTTKFTNTKSPGPVEYLFQERNKVKIQWGYLEDEDSIRTVQAHMVAFQSTFPAKNQPSFTVNCLSESYALDQISIGTGQTFTNRVLAATDPSTGVLFDFDGLTIGEIINDLCFKAGMDCIVSEKLLNEKPAEGRGEVCTPNKTCNTLLLDFARKTDSYYKVISNPKTGKATVIFISRKDLDKTLITTDPNLLFYKAKGTILKSVSILADFGQLTGTKNTQINKKGKSVSGVSTDSTVGMFKGDQKLDTDPTSNNPVPAAQGFLDTISKLDTAVSRTQIMAANEDKSSVIDNSKASAACKNRRLISMEFTTLGFPYMTPGSHTFSGIGDRYSGVYHVVNVTHTIDKNGYSCRGNAQSHSIRGQSGTKFVDEEKGNESTTTTDSKLFNTSIINIDDPSTIGKGTIEAVRGPDNAGEKYKKFILG